MNDKDKKIYDEKIQAVLADITALVAKHGCLFTLDPVDLCMIISFHTDNKVVENLKTLINSRWKASVVSSANISDYEVASPEMQEAFLMKKKLERLGTILDPMELVGIMTRIASGEKPAEVLAEYDSKIEEMDARIKSIDADPSQLLADFGSIDMKNDEEGFGDYFDEEG